MTITPAVADIEVERDLTVKGTVGSIRVHPGAALVLMGMAEREVVVASGGYARIAGTAHGIRVARGGHLVLVGTCMGDLVNAGGRVELQGRVTGRIIDEAPSP